MSERTAVAVTAGQQLALDHLRQITGSDRGGVFLTDGFALAYFGMKDDRLPASPADLVPP